MSKWVVSMVDPEVVGVIKERSDMPFSEFFEDCLSYDDNVMFGIIRVARDCIKANGIDPLGRDGWKYHLKCGRVYGLCSALNLIYPNLGLVPNVGIDGKFYSLDVEGYSFDLNDIANS